MKAKVRRWMLENAEVDRYGEINFTQLAENAAHEFEHDEWLDDETHWVWELAIDVTEIIEG